VKYCVCEVCMYFVLASDSLWVYSVSPVEPLITLHTISMAAK
jgi:hypothetical protein